MQESERCPDARMQNATAQLTKPVKCSAKNCFAPDLVEGPDVGALDFADDVSVLDVSVPVRRTPCHNLHTMKRSRYVQSGTHTFSKIFHDVSATQVSNGVWTSTLTTILSPRR
eukprot:2385148-Rhodomonas_salina.3